MTRTHGEAPVERSYTAELPHAQGCVSERTPLAVCATHHLRLSVNQHCEPNKTAGSGRTLRVSMGYIATADQRTSRDEDRSCAHTTGC